MNEQEKYMVFFSTTNSVEDARRISQHLVQEHLVACVNIVPSITSIYWWKDSVTEDQEVLMIIKTSSRKAAEVEKAIRSLHKYETPELIGIEVRYGLSEYLKWMDDSISGL
jgi:periplasmic divalent cation tolerance protein